MIDRPYTPIACGLHENYQYAVMKKAELDLRWRDVKDRIREARVLPVDVFTRDGGEYLQVEAGDGRVYTIRLDCIEAAQWASDGQSLNPIR
ncbi:MAG: transcriptional antiterminator, Rof [Candidatus Thiodiazotropha sp.]